MAYNPVYRKKRFRIKWTQFIPMLLFFCVIIGVSFYAGVLWANMTAKGREEESTTAVSQNQGGASTSGSSETGQSGSETQSSGSGESGQSESTANETVVTIPKGEYMSRSYFDDAVFIGDSITHGLAFYGLLDSERVIAGESINLESALYKTPYTDADGNALSIFEAVQELVPNKIYIMLGTNGIEWMDTAKLAEMYDGIVVKLKEIAPQATIYIQSVLPVTKELNDNVNRDLTNAKIDAFNAALLELAEKEQVYYVNVAEDFKDSEGNLPEEASPVDGVHFTVAYYQKWIEYLRYHTLEGMTGASGETSEASEASQAAEASQS